MAAEGLRLAVDAHQYSRIRLGYHLDDDVANWYGLHWYLSLTLTYLAFLWSGLHLETVKEDTRLCTTPIWYLTLHALSRLTLGG